VRAISILASPGLRETAALTQHGTVTES